DAEETGGATVSDLVAVAVLDRQPLLWIGGGPVAQEAYGGGGLLGRGGGFVCLGAAHDAVRHRASPRKRRALQIARPIRCAASPVNCTRRLSPTRMSRGINRGASLGKEAL